MERIVLARIASFDVNDVDLTSINCPIVYPCLNTILLHDSKY